MTSKRGGRSRGLVVHPRHRAQQPSQFANVGVELGVQTLDQALLTYGPVLLHQRLAEGRGAVEDLLTLTARLREAGSHQLLERVGHHVRVLVVEDEAEVGQLLVARTVAKVVHQQHVGDGEVGASSGGHTAYRPA